MTDTTYHAAVEAAHTAMQVRAPRQVTQRWPWSAALVGPGGRRIELRIVRGADGVYGPACDGIHARRPPPGACAHSTVFHLFGPAGVALPETFALELTGDVPGAAALLYEVRFDPFGVPRFAPPWPLAHTSN